MPNWATWGTFSSLMLVSFRAERMGMGEKGTSPATWYPSPQLAPYGLPGLLEELAPRIPTV